MPVLPEVGSISTVSALITPAFSIAITIAAPMRSLTLAAGLRYSSLARMVAFTPWAWGSFRKRTTGVSPTASTMESKTRPRPGRCTAPVADDASITKLPVAMIGPNPADVPYLGGAWGVTQAPTAGVKASLHRKTIREPAIAEQTHLCRDIVKQVGL